MSLMSIIANSLVIASLNSLNILELLHVKIKSLMYKHTIKTSPSLTLM